MIKKKACKYEENLKLKVLIAQHNVTITELSENIGFSRQVISMTVNGHYKGVNVAAKLKKYLNPENL